MLKVLYVDFDASHKGNFVFDIPEGQNSWLLVLTHTPAVFMVDNVLVESPPNSVILYKPGQRIYYRACEERYENDWIRFQTDEAYVTETPIPGGVPFTVRDPVFLHKLYQLITAEHEREGEMTDIIIDKLLQIIFHKLSELFDSKPATHLCKNLNELKNQIYKHPNENWTVKVMAEKLHMSVGHLERIYKKTFGVTCMEEVINSRIHLAKEYLKSSNYNITEIISLCGYHSAEHFYRQFRKSTGLTPKGYQAQSVYTDEPSTL